MPETYDAIVIGGGHNGLTCAAYLAKADQRVLVLERRDILGGATVTEEIYPGFKYSVCSYVVSLLRPQVISELDLPRHGLEILPLDGTLTPLENDDYVMRWSDGNETRRELERHSTADADAYGQFGELLYHLARAVRPILSTHAPDPTSLAPSQLRQLADVAKTFGKSKAHLFDLAKLMTMSSADFVEQWFETEGLKATLSASGIIGTFLGPRTPGSAYVMLHHYMGEIDGQFRAWGFPRGGMSGVAEAIASAARSFGAKIRTEAAIEKILVERGRASGVVLEGGEEIRAKRVISSVDPRRTFESLVGAEHFDSDFQNQIRRYRYRGSSGKVNLALDALPEFTCLQNARSWTGYGRDAHLAGAISISPSIDHLERAYDDAKYGRHSRQPYMDIIIPSLIDPSMAPPGKHVMSIFVQYAPYDLAPSEGTWDDQRESFGDAVIDTLSRFAPNLKDILLHRQVVTPLDLERRFGLTEGNIFHGELSLEQLFFLRPTAGWADYTTPLRDLYLCGSGTHPGGGVMSAPGRLAAQKILREVA